MIENTQKIFDFFLNSAGILPKYGFFGSDYLSQQKSFLSPQNKKYSSSSLAKVNKTASKNIIPDLPLLQSIVNATKNDINFEKTAFFGCQHLLETTGSLFDSLIKLGAKPENMFFTGKFYSSSPEVVEAIKEKLGIKLFPDAVPEHLGCYQKACNKNIRKMWQKFSDYYYASGIGAIEELFILDDGFRCFENMPEDLMCALSVKAGVEQTRGGLYSQVLHYLLFPIIDVASSAAKKNIESPFIIKAIFKRVEKLVDSLKMKKGSVCGIVGNGAIGEALAKYLTEIGMIVVVYDKSPNSFNRNYENKENKKLFRVGNIKTVINNATHIFGCTGEDITAGIDMLNFVAGAVKKTFISCSSEDKEFKTLLKQLKGKVVCEDPLDTIEYEAEGGGNIIILNGGYPANFNRQSWSVPNNEIELTRALLLAACIQGKKTASLPNGDGVTINHNGMLHMLNPNVQKSIVNAFAQQQPDKIDKKLLSNFQDIEWIKKNSGNGIYYPDVSLEKQFHKITLSKTPILSQTLGNPPPFTLSLYPSI